MRLRLSRRAAMYLIVGVQVLVLGAIVVPQELNIALDSGVAVDLEIVEARGAKDPFRGARVSGRPALDLDGTRAALPPEGLKAGDRVLVVFAVEAGRRPRIVRVEPRRRGGDPPFSTTGFGVPATVLGAGSRGAAPASEGAPVARVGDPPVRLALAMPAAVPVDAAALEQFSGPSMVRARLHRGYLGRRYLADVRLVGRSWSGDMSFAWDEARERLVVLAPRQDSHWAERPGARPPRSEIFSFDGLGRELASADAPGRVLAGMVSGRGGLVAVLSDEARGDEHASVAELGDDGQVIRRSPLFSLDRLVGLDPPEGAAWVLTARPLPRPPAGLHLEALTPAGPRGPRLGPLASAPTAVVTAGEQVWVVEASRHRVTRFDRRSGRVEHEYPDLNGPTTIAVDSGSLFVIEADRTQLSRLAPDGRVLWRVPRFEGLAWVVPEPGTGGGWVGAIRFEGTEGGVFRFAPDGRVALVAPGAIPSAPYGPRRLVVGAIREPRHGRLYVRVQEGVVVLGPDGARLARVEGFRYPQEQRIRH